MALVRTMLRRGSGDIVTALKLADRTGIVAASAPPAREEPVGPARAPVIEVSPVLVLREQEEFEPPGPSATRRLRRNLLFACTAALFLIVGWIGGNTFGHHETGTSAAMATGAVTGKGPVDEPGQVSAPSTTLQAPAPTAPTRMPDNDDGVGSRKATSAPVNRVAPKTSSPEPTASGQDRDDLLDRTVLAMHDPLSASAQQQLQQVVGSWPWVDLVNWGYVPGWGYGAPQRPGHR